MESLPLELIQSIGGFLAPEAIDPFTLTSKHIRLVLTRLIAQHQSLKREFGHAICGENESHGSIGNLLLNVLSRPRLHYYVRKLTIEDWHNELASKTERGLSITSLFQNEFCQFLHIDRAFLSSAITTLETEDGVFPLLLWELSELRVLRLVGEPGDESTIFDTLFNIERDPLHSSAFMFPGFLQQLAELQLDTNREGQEWMIGTAKMFANISPSLRRISASSIIDTFSEGWSTQLLAKPSNVEHLEFNSCVVADKTMHRLLQGLPRLKTFTMNEVPAHVYYETIREAESARTMRIDCYWLCVSLQMHCKDSLQSLTLNVPTSYSSSEVANFLGDISAFKNLRYLELYPEGLVRSEDSEVAVLPDSIQELRVNCGTDSESFDMMCIDSESLVEASRRRNPKLKRITVECHLIQDTTGSSQPETLESERRRQRFGVDFVFRKWSSKVQIRVPENPEL